MSPLAATAARGTVRGLSRSVRLWRSPDIVAPANSGSRFGALQRTAYQCSVRASRICSRDRAADVRNSSCFNSAASRSLCRDA